MKRKSVPSASCGNCGAGAIRVGDKFGMISVHLAPEYRRSSHYHLALCKKCVVLLSKAMPKVGEVIAMSMVVATPSTATLTFLGAGGRRG